MRKFSIFNFQFSKLFGLIILLALFLPLVSFAGTYTICEDIQNGQCLNPQTATYEGLVPCGKEILVNGTSQNIPCQLCHFFVMLDGILDFLFFRLVPIVAILMIVIAGVMFMFAYFNPAEVLPGGERGGPTLLNRAKRLLTSVILGLIIIYAAWLLVSTFLAVIGVAETNFGQAIKNWFSIPCPISLLSP